MATRNAYLYFGLHMPRHLENATPAAMDLFEE
jgi:hypothetical protein